MKRDLRTALLAALLGGLLAPAATLPATQPESWRYLGPGWFGFRNVVAVDPTDANVAYIGVHLGRGVLMTTDGGATWSASSSGLGYPFLDPSTKTLYIPSVDGIAIDPTNTQILYAATTVGLFKRTAATAPWVNLKVPTEVPFDLLESVAIAPSNHLIVYTAGVFNKIFRTTDGGAHWDTPGTGTPPGGHWFGIAVHPTNPQIAYAINENYGVFKTTDGGAHWGTKNTGFDDGGFLPSGEAIAIDPVNPQTLYAAAAEGLYKTVDGGDHWTKIKSADYPGFVTVAIDPTDPQKVYTGPGLTSGVVRTVDGGAHWNDAALPNSGIFVYGLAVAPSSPSVVYASVGGGALKSTDTGAHFGYADKGLGRQPFNAITIDPGSGLLFAGSQYSGIFRSRTAGESWSLASTGLPSAGSSIWDIAIDPDDPTIAYAGVDYTGGVYKTVNSGDSWSASNSGLPAGAQVLKFAINPASPATVYAGLGSGTVYKSTNHGANWSPAGSGLPAGSIDALVLDPKAPNVLYATQFDGSTYTPSLSKTVNGGVSWSPIGTGLPSTGKYECLLVHPTAANTLFLGTGHGLYKSTDGGAHWNPVAGGLPDGAVASIVYDAGGGANRLLFGATDVGTWGAVLKSLPPAIYAGFGGLGVFQSTDGGASWNAFSTGFVNFPYLPLLYQLATGSTRLAPSAIVVDAAPAIGTNGNGIFEPGETVKLETSWSNQGSGPVSGFSGAITLVRGLVGFDGTVGEYNLVDAAASYGTVAAHSVAGCGSNCYTFGAAAAPRPGTHWDVSLFEAVTSGDVTERWILHLGKSFADVPVTHPFYKKVETVLHNGITVGCDAEAYCPSDKVPRDQMAIFLARGLNIGGPTLPQSGTVGGDAYSCKDGGTSLFSDVLPTDSACRAIHLIAAKNVTTGCVAGMYCPLDLISRASMAIFVAKAMVAPGGGPAVPEKYGPDPVTGFSYSCSAASPKLHFQDIAVSDSFCKHAHYLWARGVIAGCDANRYCPAGAVGRDEMAKFLSNAFGLVLYGP